MAIELKTVLKTIDGRDIAPIYYLKGSDQYLQSLFIEKVGLAVFGDEPVDKTLLLPVEMSGKEIIDRLLATELFSSKKLFILRDPQQVRGNYGKDLLAYCQAPIQNHTLILVNDDFLDSSVFSKSVEKFTNPISVQTPYTQNLRSWALYFFQERKKSVQPKVVDTLIEMTGDSLHHMQNEVEKLCLWLGNKKTIKQDDLGKFSGWRRNRQRWEFLTALGDGDLNKSVSLGRIIITKNETMVSLIYPLTALFQEMLYVKMNTGTFSHPKGYMPISRSIRQRIPEFAKGFSQKKIEFALKHLGKIEKRQKTTYSNGESELIQFIYHVLG